MTQSVWVIRDRESGQYWNGFGYTSVLYEAMMFEDCPTPPGWIPFPADVLELRLIERDSDAN